MACLILSFFQSGDDDMNLKANTLPAKANESPEKLFLREVAHFRYSRKREQPLSDSMSVNTGSVCERQRRVRTGSPVLWQETMELDNTRKRGTHGNLKVI